MYIYEHTNVMLFYNEQNELLNENHKFTRNSIHHTFHQFDEETLNSLLLKSGVHFNYAEYTEE